MRRFPLMLLVLGCVAAGPAGAATTKATAEADSNRFSSPTAGFSITKPPTWVFASVEQIAAYRARVRLNDKDLEEQIRQRASAPLVAITRHPEPFDDLNPSVQVILRPLGQLEGTMAITHGEGTEFRIEFGTTTLQERH